MVNFDTDPTACLGYDEKHIYVGSETGVPSCPASPSISGDYLIIEPLSETMWEQAASEVSVGTVTVNGQQGTYVKSSGQVAFAGLQLFVVLGDPTQPELQMILQSIKGVGTIPTPSTPSTTTVALAGAISSGDGWALNEKALLLTSDGGAHWRSATPQGPAPTRINNVFFLDATHGWLTGGATTDVSAEQTFRTDDGGLTWESARVVPPSRLSEVVGAVDFDNATVTFVDQLHGWLEMPIMLSAQFSEAVLYRTADGGRSWQAAKAPVQGPLAFVSPTHGWTTGGVGSTMQLYETTDAGTSWRASTWPGEVADPVYGRQIFLPQRGVMTVQEWNADGATGRVTFYTSPSGGTTQWRTKATLPTQARVQASPRSTSQPGLSRRTRSSTQRTMPASIGRRPSRLLARATSTTS